MSQEQVSTGVVKQEREKLDQMDFISAKSIGFSDYYMLEYSETRDDRKLKNAAKAEVDGMVAWRQSQIKPDRSYINNEEELKEIRDELEKFLRDGSEGGKQFLINESHRLYKKIETANYSRLSSGRVSVERVYVADLIGEAFGNQGDKHDLDTREEQDLRIGQEKLKGFFEAAIEDGNLYLALNTFEDLYSTREITRSTEIPTIEFKRFDTHDWLVPERLATYFNSSDLNRLSRELQKMEFRASDTSSNIPSVYPAQVHRIKQIQEAIRGALEERRRVELN